MVRMSLIMVPLLRRVNDLHLFFIPSNNSNRRLTSNYLWTCNVFRFLLKKSQACRVQAPRRRLANFPQANPI